MVQKFSNVEVTDYIDEGVTKLLERDVSVLSKMSGPEFPEDPIEDMWFNNTVERKVYTYKDGEFKLLIDYSYPYLGSETIALRYQPLNENLTNFSNTKVLGKGFISHKAFVAMSDFFANSLDLRTVSNFLKQLEIADIGYKNQVTVNHVPENTISNDKFNPPLPVDPQFVTGDLLQTFKLGNKDGFISLEENRTLGALSSSASYRGSAYYPLYELLWQRNVTDVYDISGNVATRGESALSDFQNNISVGLPVKSEALDFKVNKNVISTTGTTAQNVTLNRGGYYRIAVVGGGGGGATATKHSRGATGGSGAGFVGIVKLDAGNYTMTAGAGAAASGSYNYNGYNGSASTFSVGTESLEGDGLDYKITRSYYGGYITSTNQYKTCFWPEYAIGAQAYYILTPKGSNEYDFGSMRFNESEFFETPVKINSYTAGSSISISSLDWVNGGYASPVTYNFASTVKMFGITWYKYGTNVFIPEGFVLNKSILLWMDYGAGSGVNDPDGGPLTSAGTSSYNVKWTGNLRGNPTEIISSGHRIPKILDYFDTAEVEKPEKTVLITAGGGTGGVTDSRGGYAGTLTISNSLQIVSSEVRSNGNAGTGWYGGSGGAGGASVYGGYGKGGDGGYVDWGSGYAGNSGFVELRYLGVEIPSDSNNSNNLNIESYLNGISVYIKM